MSIFNLASTADLAAETSRAQKAEAALAAKLSADESVIAGLQKAVMALQAAGTTPPVTTPPVTPPPVVTPPVVTPPTTGTVAHGKDLTRDMCLPRIPLTTKSGTVNASSLGDPAKISGFHFTGTFVPDVDCTLTDCQFDAPVNNQGHSKNVQLVNCLVSPPTPGDWAIGPNNVSASRSVLEGCSDGVRYEGSDLVECWVRTKQQSNADHNDGLQAYLAGTGGSILRCNIDARPVGASGGNVGNAALFFADGSKGTVIIHDNYLAGGQITLRLHESMKYDVTGNIIEKGSYVGSPVSTTNAVSGAFLAWSNNTLSDGTVLSNS